MRAVFRVPPIEGCILADRRLEQDSSQRKRSTRPLPKGCAGWPFIRLEKGHPIAVESMDEIRTLLCGRAYQWPNSPPYVTAIPLGVRENH